MVDQYKIMLWKSNLAFKLTFKSNKNISVVMPNEASFQPIEFKCVKKCFHAGIKLLEGAFKPNRLFICALPMVTAAAVVKPIKTSYI